MCPLTYSQTHIPTYVFGVNRIFHHDFVLFSLVDIAAQMALNCLWWARNKSMHPESCHRDANAQWRDILSGKIDRRVAYRKKPVASVAGMKNAVRKGANDGLNRNLAVVVR